MYVNYRSLYDPSDYIADEVKIEVSVRSLKYLSQPNLSNQFCMKFFLTQLTPKPLSPLRWLSQERHF